ncbi:reverse transcriptase domain-containing protein [Tanacetum coccineum]
MAEEDEDKTAFFTGEGVFCYQKMPFGLKNAGATYQRLVDKVFHDQIGRNLEAYFDDMVIKSTSEEEILADIKETFERFRSINMKLNPKKCSFGIEEGPLLGHLITKQGIQANPSKVKSITDVEQLTTLKDNIQWTQEAKAALQEMKKFAEILPTLTALVQGEVLMMYLTASTESISAPLFAKREEEQVPIYFVSRVLQGDELNYPGMEKLILALVHAARRLQRGDETPKDFLIEVPLEDNNKEAKEKADTKLTKTELSCEWKLFIDRAASSDGSGAGLMLIDPEGKEYTYALRFEFETTNNEAEYEALLAGLRISQEIHTAPHTDDIIKEVHEDAAKVLQDCEKCKEQSAIRKVAKNSVITAKSGWPFSHWGVNILGPLATALEDFKFLEIACADSEYHEQSARRTKNIYEKVDDLAQVLWVHRTLPRNSQKDTPFSLTYGSEAIILISENDVTKDDRGRIKEVDKKRGSKEIASIKDAYYRSKLRRYHNERSSHSIYKIGDFVLLLQNNTGSTQVWQDPHMGFTTEASAGGDIGLETGTEDGVAL